MARPPRPDPAQPHDALIRYAFSQREHAEGLLRAALPPALVAAIAWPSLRIHKGSFVDRALRSRHCDLIFSAKIGEARVYLYTLIEQQRRVEPLMVFRIGVYMMRLWEHLIRDKPALRKLPPIVPILIHHSATGWTAATSFEEVVDIPVALRAALLPHTLRFGVALVDLSPGRASNLVEQALTALGQVVLWCLSVTGDDARLEREIGRITRALDAVLAAPDAVDALTALLRYLLATHPRKGAPAIVRLLETTATAKEQRVMVDVLDVFRREGRAEGKAEGLREGRARTLLEQLAARFGRVPEDAKARVLAATTSTLSRWSLRVLTAPTLEAVFAAPAKKSAAPAKKRAAPRRAAPRKRVRST